MNMGKKDLDTWGRSKAKDRYTKSDQGSKESKSDKAEKSDGRIKK